MLVGVRSLVRRALPSPASPAVASRAYSRRSRLHDESGGWYGQQLRATTILSVRKDDKVVRAADAFNPSFSSRGSVSSSHIYSRRARAHLVGSF